MADAEPTSQTYEHRSEDALEPAHLIRRSDVVLRAGTLMLAAGTGSRRVKETMRAVSDSLDLDRLQAQVSFTEIVLTVARRGIFRTQVAEVAWPGVNADRIARLQALATDLEPHMTVDAVERRLDAVVARGHLYPAWAGPIAAALACCSFAFLNNARWLDLVAVAFAAALGQYVRARLARVQLNQLGIVLVCSVLAGATYLGVTELLLPVAGAAATNHEAGFVSAILFLVPGVPLITATLDLARLDLSAGISRLTYAGLVTLAASLGLWGVAALAGQSTQAAPPLDLATALLWALRAVATFGGVVGFAIVFNSPMRVALGAGAIATVANLLRIALVESSVSPQVAAAAATLVLGVVAWGLGRAAHLPRIILSVPAVVIMIPGAVAYRALVRFNQGDVVGALTEGVAAVLTVIGLAAGLAAARMLTDPLWAFNRPDPPDPRSILAHAVRH
jgi:uncharacterized membrane protein YjjP (DUF1212 family)